jgi:ABC-type transport system substrate-binding protein
MIFASTKILAKRLVSRIFPFLVLNILGLIYACSPVDKSESVNFFRYNEDAGISTLDPAFVRSQAEIWATSQLFEGLVELDEQLHVVPCIADSWYVDKQQLSYTFILNKNIFFVDNQGNKLRRITAADVAYSFSRVVSPVNASPGAWIFNGKIDTHLLLSNDTSNPLYPFYAPHDDTFVLNLTQVFNPMLSMLAMPYCFVVMPEAVQKYKQEFRLNPIGTGPFHFVKWEEEVALLFHKNKHYHQFKQKNQLPFLNGVYIELNKNKQSAFMGFIAGDFDMLNGKLNVPYNQKFKLLSAPFLNAEFIGFNLDSIPPPLSSSSYKEFRYILNLATNKQEIITFLKNGFGIPATNGFVPMGLANFDSVRTASLTYNLPLAMDWMNKNGFSAKKPLHLTLHTTADYVDIAVLLKNQWKKIWVALDIEVHPGNYLRQIRNQGKLVMFRSSWIADYPDPENFLACFYSPFHPPNGPNYTRFSNPFFDSVFVQANLIDNPNQRMKSLAFLDSLVTANPPLVFLFYDKSVRLLSKNIHGFDPHPMNFLKLKYVSKSLN